MFCDFFFIANGSLSSCGQGKRNDLQKALDAGKADFTQLQPHGLAFKLSHD